MANRSKTKYQGAAMIAAERRRQITKEGFNAQHDDNPLGHGQGQIAAAAITYLMATRTRDDEFLRRFYWPWERHEFKPETTLRNLVKAGALVAAEIDRLMRKDDDDDDT